MIWIHKDCGYSVESELLYSDTDRDYYVPICPVHGGLHLKELEFVQAEGAD